MYKKIDNVQKNDDVAVANMTNNKINRDNNNDKKSLPS